MKRYYITIEAYGGQLKEMYIRARKGLTGQEVAEAWNRIRPTRCVAVRDARTHELLWSASTARQALPRESRGRGS